MHFRVYKYSFLIFFILLSISLFSQSIVITKTIIKGDTIAQIKLNEVLVLPAYKFTSDRQRRRYMRLERYIRKVYPYAKLANETLSKINDNIDSIDSKRAAKKYIKQVDKVLQDRYGKELKKLTVMQGRLLIKLIDRETGSTSYELIKELRGGFSAFMWQSLARLFGENLKEEYNKEEEDKMIEHIVLRIESELQNQ